MNYLTTEGRKQLTRAREAGLTEFFNPQMGNIIIPDYLMSDFIFEKVLHYLDRNPDSVMGKEEDYYFITKTEDL